VLVFVSNSLGVCFCQELKKNWVASDLVTTNIKRVTFFETLCIYGLQLSADTGDVELTKLLTLKQYLHIYSEIKRHVSDASYSAAEPHYTIETARADVLDASVIMMQLVITLLRCNSSSS